MITSTFAQFHNTDPRAILTFFDRGGHINAQLRCYGPLDGANFDKAVAWVREVCAAQFTKPVIMTTETGKLLLLPENGKTGCERIMTRRRAQ